jgi:pimeloyl-ACP methyl ester carboxylesterase
MKNPLYEFLRASRPVLLDGLHQALKNGLRGAGFRFEQRRAGDCTLGLWRLTYRKVPKGRLPRRLVLIPGFGDTPLSWLLPMTMVQPILRSRYDELVCIDFPGFAGFLRENTCLESMDRLLEMAGDALDALKPRAILGHSLGGWVAADYATRTGEGSRPKRKAGNWKGPRKVILVCPSGVFGSETEKKDWENLFRRAMETGFEAIRSHMFEREPKWFRLVAREVAQFTKRDDIKRFMESFRDEHRLEERLPRVKGEVWLLWGARDRLVPSGWLPAWKRALRDAPAELHTVTLPGVGHSPQLEAPLVLAALLGQILSGREPHRAGSRFWSYTPAGAGV